MPVSAGPTVPTESSTGVPAGGFSQWFRNIGDWLKTLSPSGVSQYDTDWLTTGLTITPATNWSVDNYRIRRIGRVQWIEAAATYSGATITVDGGGNIPDTVVATLPTGWGTPGMWPADVQQNGVKQWFGRLNGNRQLMLTHGLPGMTLPTGTQIAFRVTAPVD